MRKLTVVIVSYNVRHYVEQCIVSVQKATRSLDCEIFVVDNNSGDGTVEYLTQRFGDEISLIAGQHNIGFARANNMAISQSESEYVLLLNPDTFVAEDAIEKVVSFMDEHSRCSGVGVRMHNSDGSLAPESRRALPTPWVSLLKMLGFSRRYYMSHLSWDEPGRIDVISGAFFMLRRKTLDEVGLLDNDFFMYGEDIDLSYRILKKGYENWFVPADIVHYKGESTQKSSYRYVHVFYQAMLIFFRKHYGHMSLFVTLPIKLAIYLRAFMALVRMLYDRMLQSLGLAKRDRIDDSYHFIGADKTIELCRSLSRRRGLTAFFHTVSEASAADVQTEPGACVVYDTGLFSYKDIIDDAYSRQDISIGTMLHNGKTIITPSEIIE